MSDKTTTADMHKTIWKISRMTSGYLLVDGVRYQSGSVDGILGMKGTCQHNVQYSNCVNNFSCLSICIRGQ